MWETGLPDAQPCYTSMTYSLRFPLQRDVVRSVRSLSCCTAFPEIDRLRDNVEAGLLHAYCRQTSMKTGCRLHSRAIRQ